MQLASTPPLQSTTPGVYPVSIHQTSPLVRGGKHPITAYYSIYRPRNDERLSRPAWLVTYRNKLPPPGVEPGHVTHPSTNRARRRVTSLIRPTMLPLRHAAIISHWIATLSAEWSCCSPPSNLVCGQLLIIWSIVCYLSLVNHCKAPLSATGHTVALFSLKAFY